MVTVMVHCGLFKEPTELFAVTLFDLKRVIGELLDAKVEWNNRSDVRITNNGKKATISYTGDTYLLEGDKVEIERYRKHTK